MWNPRIFGIFTGSVSSIKAGGAATIPRPSPIMEACRGELAGLPDHVYLREPGAAVNVNIRGANSF